MSVAYSHLGLVALPFETTTSFRKGTVKGPSALIKELDNLDHFDMTLGRDPFRGVPINVKYAHTKELRDPLMQQAMAGRAVSKLLDSNGFPLCIGGEHTVSLGPIRAARTRGTLGVVQLDAHSDLRNIYEDDYFSHACVMRRVLELDCSILGIGIRAMGEEEAEFAREHGLKHVEGRDAATSTRWYDLLNILPERVYLTIDMDVFDPQEVPAVGTPEPGGPGYDAVVSFLQHLFSVKDVVAADIVELMPCEGDEASIRLAARLAGIVTGLRFPETKKF
jgi:agmatinase